jgi:hypothetical protein
MRQQSTKSGISGGGDGDGNSNKQQRLAAATMTTDDVKGREVETIGVEGNNKDCSTDAGSLLTMVIVNGGGNGMEPIETIGVDEGCMQGNSEVTDM